MIAPDVRSPRPAAPAAFPILIGLAILCAAPARGAIIYEALWDTSPLNGRSGSIDILISTFPGGDAQPFTASFGNWSSSYSGFGPPDPFVLDFNQNLIALGFLSASIPVQDFGPLLATFEVVLDGPAILSPDPTRFDGSTIQVGISYSGPRLAIDPFDPAFWIEINPGILGFPTTLGYVNDPSVTTLNSASGGGSGASVPEPGAGLLALTACGIAAAFAALRAWRSAASTA